MLQVLAREQRGTDNYRRMNRRSGDAVLLRPEPCCMQLHAAQSSVFICGEQKPKSGFLNKFQYNINNIDIQEKDIDNIFF